MSKNWLKISFFFGLVWSATAIFTACNSNEQLVTDEEVQNYTDEAIFRMQEEGNCGKFGCFEFVFPLTIEFPDGSTVSVGSYDELRETIAAWKEANPEATDRPSLVFPLELLSEEGEAITVANIDELHELGRSCRRGFFGGHGPKGHHNRGMHCFELVFPVSILFPDGNTVEVAGRDALKTELRAWKEANPDSTDRPELVFPITVELEDGTTTEVATIDDLKVLKDSCGQ